VTRNQSEKKINSILDFVSSSTDAALLQDLYETTLTALEESKNERLWFKTNLKLASLWFSKVRGRESRAGKRKPESHMEKSEHTPGAGLTRPPAPFFLLFNYRPSSI
jgi:hypothetical protein